MIPFRVKKLTETAKPPHRNCESDLWDIYVDDFCVKKICEYTPINQGLDGHFQGNYEEYHCEKWHQDFVEKVGKYNKCVGVGQQRDNISSYQLQSFRKIQCDVEISKDREQVTLWSGARVLIKTGIAIELPVNIDNREWGFVKNGDDLESLGLFNRINSYAVADIRSRSGLCVKHGIRVANGVGTIDNSYRQEIGVIIENFGHEPYTIKKGMKIAQMLIRSLEPSQFEVVDEINFTERGGFGSTGR